MRAGSAGQAFGRVLVDELIRCGMQHACLSPGSRSTPVALALAEHPDIKLHVLVDERSASFLALGIARESRRPVAMLTTSGTASANVFPAVIESHHSGVPLLVLTADRPPELRDTGAGQTIDQLKLFGSFVRWFAEAGVPEVREASAAYWRSLASRAYLIAGGLSPGPVHLNLPFREPLVPDEGSEAYPYSLEGKANKAPWIKPWLGGRPCSEQDAAALADKLARAERGLIVAGSCNIDAAPVVALAQAAGWPLLAEPTSNARTGSNAISMYEGLLRSSNFAETHLPDVVVRVGSLGTSPSLNALLGPEVDQIAIDPTGSWADPRRATSWFIQADPEDVCAKVAAKLTDPGSGDWLKGWLTAERSAREAVDRFLDDQHEISEPGVARDLADILPDGSQLVVASSMPVRDLDWFMRPRPGLRIHANRGANGIDGFVSTSLGVALSSGTPTAALCGDLSFLHDQNGLMLGRMEQPDLVFVVINNNGGGIFNFLPQAVDKTYFETIFGTPQNLDLAGLAETYGCGYDLIEKAHDLAPMVKKAQSEGGLQVLEAQTDRVANVDVHRELWDLIGRSIE